MRLSIISRLRCPAAGPRTACNGALVLESQAPSPVVTLAGRELHEGLLACTECGASYPVVTGVPLLLPNILSWLRFNYYYVMEGAARVGGIGPGLMAWLDDRDWHLGNQLADNYYETPRWVNIFSVTHYVSPCLAAPGSSLLDTLVASRPSVFEVAARMIGRHLAKPAAFALDVGTNVGGMAYRLGEFAGAILGIDVAFNPVLMARRVNLGLPLPIEQVRQYLDGHHYAPHEVRRGPENAEFLVASIDHLPVQGRFGLITALNVVDVVAQPRSFLARVSALLETDGLLLVTSPYSWASDSVPIEEWLGGTRELASADAVRDTMRSCDLEIVEEVDDVPWVLQEHRRWYRVFLNHCILARKRGDGG